MRPRRCTPIASRSRWCCSSIAYAVVFSFGIYYINRLIAKGLDSSEARHTGQFAASPISAAHEG